MLKSANNYNSSWLVNAIKIGLFASLFMPLIVNGSFIFPYIFPKQAFFQIVVEIIFALYLWLAFKDPAYRPRSSWLFRALLAYFVVMILSSVFGVNTYHSFWSNYERMAGVISLGHYLGFLFVAVNIFKTQKDWHLFFDVSIFASVAEAFFGLGQLAGIFSSSGGVRIDGTIGNASFLAGYMLINAFFAFWLMLEKKQTGWRIFYAGVIFLNLLIMYQTETRGAVLGLVAALMALLIILMFSSKKALAQWPGGIRLDRIKLYGGIFLAAIVLSAGLLRIYRDSTFVQNHATLARVAHITLKEATVQTRLLAWKMSLKGLAERPIFGWGPENYYVVFNKYYDPQLYPVESWFDRAHNAYLDILVNTGLIGFAAYLAMVAMALWYLWLAWRQERIQHYTAVIFTVILIAYAIQNFFVFDTQVTLLMIYSILAFIVFLSLAPASNPVGRPNRPNSFFVILVAAALLFFLYFINIKPGLASITGIKAMQTLQSGKVDEAIAQFKTAYDIETFGLPEVAMRTQDTAVGLALNNKVPPEIKNKIADLAIDGMNRALALEPLNVRFMMMLSTVYFSVAAPGNSYLAEADMLLQKALELSPTREELYFYIGQVRMFQGRGDEALAVFKKAVELNDKVTLSHWNYGVIAIGMGQKDLGAKEIKIARDLDHTFGPADIKQLINAYNRTNDLPRIIQLYQEWIDLSPNGAEPYAGLAGAYAQVGDKLKARDSALRAAALDPGYKDQAEEFVKGLGK